MNSEAVSERWRRMDRFTKIAVTAARRALREAGLREEDLPKEMTGVVLGTRYGPIESNRRFMQEIFKYGAHLASAFLFPSTVMNIAAGMISMELGIKGPGTTLITDKDPMEEAVSYASDLIKHGKAEVMLAGAVDEEGAEVVVVAPSTLNKAMC